MYSALVPVRSLTKFVVGASVGRVVSQVIKNNVVAVSRTERIRLVIASSVISGMMADAAAKYAEKEFDKIVRTAEKLKIQIQELRDGKPVEQKDTNVEKEASTGEGS